MKSKRLIFSFALGSSLALATPIFAETVTWNGGNYTWANADSDSFGSSTYDNGDNATFTNTGITSATVGQTAIVLSALAPGNVTFSQTGAIIGGATGSPGALGTNYLFTSAGTANVINATDNLTLNGGNTIFRAITTNGTYTNNFAGALNYSGGVMLGISSDNAARISTVQVGSLAAPTAGNSILFNALTSASVNTSGAAWSATTNRLIVTGSKPTVPNGMVSAGLQFYAGGNLLGDFMTFSGNNLVPVTAYASYAADWAAATSTDIVNLTAATTLTGSGDMNIHALRVAGATQDLGNRTVKLGSGGLIMTSTTISNGFLDFGTGPAYIGAYNAAGQGEITARLKGSGGLTIMGTSQGLRLSNNNNTFTGGLFINGGSVVLGANVAGDGGRTAVNGNNVTVNDLGALAVNVTTIGGAVIGGLSGDGHVSPQYQLDNTKNRAITLSPASGTHTFNGTIRNGAGGSVLTVYKDGAGTQVFGTGITATYTGETKVNDGKLVIDGTLTSTDTTVTSTATKTAILAGHGTVQAITLSGGTTFGGRLDVSASTGSALGDMSATSLIWNGTTDSAFSQMKFDLGSGNASDKLDLSGAMTKGTGSIFEWDFGGTGVLDNTYTLVTAAGGFGSGASLFTAGNFSYKNLASGLTGSFSISGSNLQFATSYSPIPEPTSALAGLLITAGLFRRRRG